MPRIHDKNMHWIVGYRNNNGKSVHMSWSLPPSQPTTPHRPSPLPSYSSPSIRSRLSHQSSRSTITTSLASWSTTTAPPLSPQTPNCPPQYRQSPRPVDRLCTATQHRTADRRGSSRSQLGLEHSMGLRRRSSTGLYQHSPCALCAHFCTYARSDLESPPIADHEVNDR